MVGLSFEDLFEGHNELSKFLWIELLPEVEKEQDTLVAGQLIDRRSFHQSRKRSRQDTISVGHGGHDAVGECILSSEKVACTQIPVARADIEMPTLDDQVVLHQIFEAIEQSAREGREVAL